MEKKYCQLTSIIIPEVWSMPGGKGAPPARHHGRFGHVVRKANLPFQQGPGFLWTTSHVVLFFFFVLVSMGFPSLLKGKRVVEPPPWVVFVAAIMALESFGIH
jgi:hypothetical protein